MSANTTAPSSTTSAPTWRVAPSVPVALGVALAYIVVFTTLSMTSGVPYADWFADGATAFRTAVVPLIGGSLVIVAFLVWARWDWVFKDPAPLPRHRFLWVPVAAFAFGIIVHLAVADWSQVSAGLVLAILAAAVLVGFAEETLFRGIILRGLRTNLRPEAMVMLISSLLFGFFHMTNLLNGAAFGAVLSQCLMASAMGVVLYTFRRMRGLLLLGIIAHGLWDFSVFLPARTGTASLVSFGMQLLVVGLAVATAVVYLRRERRLTMSEDGPVSLAGPVDGRRTSGDAPHGS